MTKVVLTGASGLLGSNVLLNLLEDETVDEVVATYRSAPTVHHLRKLVLERGHSDRVRFVERSLDDVDGLVGDLDGADVLFHMAAAVSILAKVTPTLQTANVEGTQHVLDAVRQARVPRLVHTSSTVCTGIADVGAPDVDEDTVWNLPAHGLDDGYATTKKRSEELVQAAVRGEGGDVVDAVIINPGYLFGPYDTRPSSGKLLLDLWLGKVPGLTPGVNCFVHVDDVAKGMLLAWRKGRSGERYILGGHNLSYAELFPLAAARAGTKAPSLRVPRWMASLIGAAGDAQYALTGREPLLTSAAVRWSFCEGFRLSSAKAHRELGYRTRPIEEALDDLLAWFRSTGALR